MANIAVKKMNDAQNGVEIYFEVYPLTGTKSTLKKGGFRWNPKKGCWYAKQSPETINIADICEDTTITEYEQIAKQTDEEVMMISKKTATKSEKSTTKKDIIDLTNLGENAPHLHGAELAAAIRADLKKRGVSGVTVRARKVTYDTGITVTIKATSADIASVEEYKERYNYSHFSCDAECSHGVFDGSRWIYSATWSEMTEEDRATAYDNHIRYYLAKSPDFYGRNYTRNDYPSITTDFYNKVVAVYQIANQWNYDNSDIMTDYFDVGYYLDIDIKLPADYEIREEMTDTERKAYAAEIKAEEEKRKAEYAQYLKEQEESEKRRKAYEEKRKADRATIAENITVVDLAEDEQLYITGLVGGIGKESNMEELNESIKDQTRREDAVITRKVIFSSRESFDLFTDYLLDDFGFLDKMGGTASEDIRLENVDHIYSLNTEQRESVKWFMCKCVAIYCGDTLELVSNPEGYSYSRYTYKLTEESTITSASKETEKQRKESENKPAFYFPLSVAEQVQAIKPGQSITIYQDDGWDLCNVYAGFGEVVATEPGTWAQYKGVYITLSIGKKTNTVFIRDNKDCLIYDGIKPLLPDSVTKRKISERMSEIYTTDVLFGNILKYYGEQGEKPILDTIQR